MKSSASIQGVYETKSFSRSVHVNRKGCGRLLVRGFKGALIDSDGNPRKNILDIDFRINNRRKNISVGIVGDRIILPFRLTQEEKAIKKNWFFGLFKTKKTIYLPKIYHITLTVKYDKII